MRSRGPRYCPDCGRRLRPGEKFACAPCERANDAAIRRMGRLTGIDQEEEARADAILDELTAEAQKLGLGYGEET